VDRSFQERLAPGFFLHERLFPVVADRRRQLAHTLSGGENVELALRLAHRGYSLESGRTILSGPVGGAAPVCRGQARLLGDIAL
jgi:ABC-type branched-subunit amino acid transport system ATPase component